MKYILIITLIMATYFTLFGDIKVNKQETNNIIDRFIISLVSSLLICLIFGLPILGVLYLFTI